MSQTLTETQLLIVDDDPEIRDLLSAFLRQNGFVVSVAENGEAMLRILQQQSIQLIVMDLMLPGEDGISLCRKVRQQSSLPIIMLTAMSTETDRIVGLEVGADDYLVKPFSPRELLARIRAVLRRSERNPDSPAISSYRFGEWQLQLTRRELSRLDGTTAPLSSGEYDMLVLLVENAGKIVSRDFLMERTRGRENTPYDRAVDIQLSRLRRKLGDDSRNPQIIKTVRGGGYIFALPVQTQ